MTTCMDNQQMEKHMPHHKSCTWITLGGNKPPRLNPTTNTWGYLFPAYGFGTRATVRHVCPIHTEQVSKWFRTARDAYHWYQQQLALFDTCC